MSRLGNMTTLLKHFEEMGHPRARNTVMKWIREKRLVLPRDPVTSRPAMTAQQIDEIVKQFMPGGQGYWKSPTFFNEEQEIENQQTA